LLETVWDPFTIHNLRKLRVSEGWHCLEVAGGAGSIASWLCREVGSNGHVIATDLEPRFLEAIQAPNLQAMRHDLLADPLPEAAFDLVHARAVLTFLSRPAEAIRKMAAALKLGGVLLVEEPDYISAVPDPSMTPSATALSRKGWDALVTYLRSRSYDTEFGRHLYHDVAISGLTNLEAEGYVFMQMGGTPAARFWRVTLEQIQEQVLAAGLLTAAELCDFIALLESPEFRWVSLLMMSVSARRALSPSPSGD